MQSALVTGGAGFIGGHLVRALLADGVEVVVMDDLSSGSMGNVPAGVTVYVHDVSEPWPALPPFSVCFHLAAVSRIGWGEEAPARTERVNVGGTLKALLRSQSGGAKLVLASSCAAAEPKLNAYARSKFQAERTCVVHESGFGKNTVAVARLFNVFGPGEPAEGKTATLVARARRAARAGEPLPLYGGGGQKRDFVHVADAVAALRLLAERETDARPYDVGLGMGWTPADVAALLRCRTTAPPAPHPEMARAVADPRRLAALGWVPQHNLGAYLAAGGD